MTLAIGGRLQAGSEVSKLTDSPQGSDRLWPRGGLCQGWNVGLTAEADRVVQHEQWVTQGEVLESEVSTDARPCRHAVQQREKKGEHGD